MAELVNKVWERNGHNWSDCTLSADELTEAMASLSDKEAETLGLTEDQIKTLRDLATQAEKTGTPISELIASLNKPSGKELLIESFQNAVKGATQVAKAFKQAFSEMFVSTGSGTESVVYKLIERIRDLSEYLVINDEKFDKLKRTIKGFIALIQIVSDITSGGLKIAFKLISGVLKYFDIDILSVTATIGDFLVKFHETVNVSDAVGKALDAVLPHIAKIITNVKKLGNGIKEIAKLPSFEVIKDKVVRIGNIFGGFIKKITTKMHFPTIEDFLKLLENVWDIGSKIGEKVVSIGKKIGTALADAFGFVDADSSFEHFLDIFDSSVISGILVGILLFVNNVKKAVSDMSLEQFFAKSGLIENVVVGDQQITGTLVGVTILGDSIKGGTVIADKLVIKGEDGLYYKLNTDGNTVEKEQTDYNSLDGGVIRAKSITATKIAVDDLIAFGATIGGWHIVDGGLYSGTKESMSNISRGTYLGSDGQINVGDSDNFIMFYVDNKGESHLAISADKFTLGKQNIENVISDIKQDVDNVRDEITTLLRIESSRGIVFKNNAVSTVLSVVIYHGKDRITDIDRLHEVYGNSAYIQWKWQRLDEDSYGIISSADSRMGNDGFSFTLSPDDVDVKVTFMCELITD